MTLSSAIRVSVILLVSVFSGRLNAQFTVLMENYPPNSYFEEIPSKVTSEVFHRDMLKNVTDPERVKLLKDSYQYDERSKNYLLKNELPPVTTEELKNLLINIEYLKPSGFEVDITREVFSRMGIKPVYKFYPWKRCIEMMKTGSADAIITIFKTPDREKFLYYPSEYNILTENALFCLKENPIRFDGNLEKLKNYNIAVKTSTSYDEKFDKAGYLKKIGVAYTQDVIRLVENKRVQLGVGPIRGIKFFAGKMGNLNKFTFLKPSICNDPLYTAFSKKKCDQKFVGEFSRQMQTFRKTAKYNEILFKYGL